nr:Putative binding-protein-dependent transporter [uncultured bacterium]
MWTYVIRRLLLIIPTLLGVVTINFFIINMAPGGPMDQIQAQMKTDCTTYTGIPNDLSQHMDCQLDEGTINKLKKEFGFDQPLLTRYVKLLWNYLRFDFGISFYKGKPVSEMIKNALPVSLGLTLLSLLCIFLVSIPLGIFKAVKDGQAFDWITTLIIGASYATPGFIFAVWLLIFFAGGSFWNWFPVRGLASDMAENFTWFQKIMDYLWHLVLPVLSIVLGHFARPTLVTKSALSDEISKLYVIAVRAKGASESYILMQHCLKNALLVICSTVPYVFLSIFFYTTLMIEFVFSLEGIGYLGYEAVTTRDYPVMFATIYLFSLSSLVLLLLFDVLYAYLDPRVNLNERR